MGNPSVLLIGREISQRELEMLALCPFSQKETYWSANIPRKPCDA